LYAIPPPMVNYERFLAIGRANVDKRIYFSNSIFSGVCNRFSLRTQASL
jgi:hypothetical protein